jgi:hypothetical protein
MVFSLLWLFVDPLDGRGLFAQGDGYRDFVRRRYLANANFLDEDKALLDDEDFFNDGDDRGVAFNPAPRRFRGRGAAW